MKITLIMLSRLCFASIFVIWFFLSAGLLKVLQMNFHKFLEWRGLVARLGFENDLNPNPAILLPAGSARRAALPVFRLLTGRFWGFSPRRGDTLHRSK